MKLQELAFDELCCICSHLGIVDVLHLQQTCKLFLSAVIAETYWKLVCSRGLILNEYGDVRYRSNCIPISLRHASYEWFGKSIFRSLLAQKKLLEFGLPLELVASSVPDRPEERAENVLTISRCKTLINVLRNGGVLAQYHCGCAQNRPCYFSSKGSRRQDTDEFMMFRVHSLSQLVGVTVTPYQAHFQDGAPVFAPQFIRFDLFSPKESISAPKKKGKVSNILDSYDSLWSSPLFPVVNESKTQLFIFPGPLMVNEDCIIWISLVGKQQRQPISDNDDFYACISNIKLLGFSVRLPAENRLDHLLGPSSAAVSFASIDTATATSESSCNSQPCLELSLSASDSRGWNISLDRNAVVDRSYSTGQLSNAAELDRRADAKDYGISLQQYFQRTHFAQL